MYSRTVRDGRRHNHGRVKKIGQTGQKKSVRPGRVFALQREGRRVGVELHDVAHLHLRHIVDINANIITATATAAASAATITATITATSTATATTAAAITTATTTTTTATTTTTTMMKTIITIKTIIIISLYYY